MKTKISLKIIRSENVFLYVSSPTPIVQSCSFLVPLMDRIKNEEESLSQKEEDDKIEKEFVAEQLLKIAMKMDYSDNAGVVKDLKTYVESVIKFISFSISVN